MSDVKRREQRAEDFLLFSSSSSPRRNANAAAAAERLIPATSSHAELSAMESRRTSLLGRAESLKRSGAELPDHFHRNVHNLTHTWRQLEVLHTHTHTDGIWSVTLIFQSNFRLISSDSNLQHEDDN
ncbi:hypothetical protein EYF80_057661 [Liparis tanakae]|uniref:Uncharacterized protein n=1 Tax=Liparis tanakae TaxID=230148 RepID=A0A4Z2EU69_9TELE|nr:hypothetical protein EYF80_057661 [Liparis tanakae]